LCIGVGCFQGRFQGGYHQGALSPVVGLAGNDNVRSVGQGSTTQ
jgi:hypothetical protein